MYFNNKNYYFFGIDIDSTSHPGVRRHYWQNPRESHRRCQMPDTVWICRVKGSPDVSGPRMLDHFEAGDAQILGNQPQFLYSCLVHWDILKIVQTSTRRKNSTKPDAFPPPATAG
jgi:hypothetical protein